jgi:hypothetical protein
VSNVLTREKVILTMEFAAVLMTLFQSGLPDSIVSKSLDSLDEASGVDSLDRDVHSSVGGVSSSVDGLVEDTCDIIGQETESRRSL